MSGVLRTDGLLYRDIIHTAVCGGCSRTVGKCIMRFGFKLSTERRFLCLLISLKTIVLHSNEASLTFYGFLSFPIAYDVSSFAPIASLGIKIAFGCWRALYERYNSKIREKTPRLTKTRDNLTGSSITYSYNTEFFKISLFTKKKTMHKLS